MLSTDGFVSIFYYHKNVIIPFFDSYILHLIIQSELFSRDWYNLRRGCSLTRGIINIDWMYVTLLPKTKQNKNTTTTCNNNKNKTSIRCLILCSTGVSGWHIESNLSLIFLLQVERWRHDRSTNKKCS